jgi:hypothetical protein
MIEAKNISMMVGITNKNNPQKIFGNPFWARSKALVMAPVFLSK